MASRYQTFEIQEGVFKTTDGHVDTEPNTYIACWEITQEMYNSIVAGAHLVNTNDDLFIIDAGVTL